MRIYDCINLELHCVELHAESTANSQTSGFPTDNISCFVS